MAMIYWFSFYSVGALISSFLTGIMMPSIGRKWTLILLTVPLILGWICLLIPAYKIDIGTPALFYIGRILTGLGGGGFALAPNVYIAEASILIPYLSTKVGN